MSRGTMGCTACGFEGRTPTEVKVGLVEYSDPIQVEVEIPVAETRHGVVRSEYVRVPGRYGAEPRCVDTKACADRVAAQSKQDDVEAFFAGGDPGVPTG